MFSTQRESNQLITFVVQTPFQLYSALAIRIFYKGPADLWLVDPALRSFLERAKQSNAWNHVHYVEVNEKSANSKRSGWRAFSRIVLVKYTQHVIRRYLKARRPSSIIIFGDNHEILACFARLSKTLIAAQVVMVEEGASVYFSFARSSAPWLRRVFRRLVGIDNPKGFQIGWCPHIDTVVVSRKDLAHPDYLQRREVIEFPRGPFPPVEQELLALAGLKNHHDLQKEIDILWLGQPWTEVGVLQEADESEMLGRLNDDSVSSRLSVKVHPFERREKYDRYPNLNVLSRELDTIPAEIICQIKQPSCIVSMFSSTSINYCARVNLQSALIILPGMPMDVRLLAKRLSDELSVISVYDNVEDVLNFLRAMRPSHEQSRYTTVDVNGWRGLVERL